MEVLAVDLGVSGIFCAKPLALAGCELTVGDRKPADATETSPFQSAHRAPDQATTRALAVRA